MPVTNDQLRSGLGNQFRGTPGALRILSLLCVIAIVATAVTAWFLTDDLVSRTEQIQESTGEVLVQNQTILASLSEADAAAAAVHLAGAEGDREQLRLYEQALERAGSGLEQVARVLGDDEESHLALQRINTAMTQYAGVVAEARLASVENLPDANERLGVAIDLLRTRISPDVDFVTERAATRLTDGIGHRLHWIAAALLVIPILLLAVAQFWLFRRFHRLINVPLALATLALAGLAIWLAVAFLGQQDALAEARDGGYESIEVTADIQAAAFEYRARETAGVIEGASPQGLDSLRSQIDDLIVKAAVEADSPREDAAVTEMLTRWARHVGSSDVLAAATASGDLDFARSLVRGESNSTFAGFNTSVEAALFDNRTQFIDAVATARSSLAWLRLGLVVVATVAALLTWLGFSLRMREYR